MRDVEPAVSVVVATYNRAGSLDALLNGLREQSGSGVPFEAVIIDNASTDSTREVLDRHSENCGFPLRVIRIAANSGPAPARDAGWRAARAPLIAFTDDDCRPAAGWLAAGLAGSDANPGGIVQGRTEPEPTQLGNMGPFSRTVEVRELHAAFHTCNIFYPRELLERIDGFDVDTFSLGGEDCDLAWRAIGAGAAATFAPDAVVFHEVADLGPIGKLRIAARWGPGMAAFVRHPGLRRALFYDRVFWKQTHHLLVRALLALALRGRLRLLRPLFVIPYLRTLWGRGKMEGGGPLLAPYFALYDLVELVTVLRAAVRFRNLML